MLREASQLLRSLPFIQARPPFPRPPPAPPRAARARPAERRLAVAQARVALGDLAGLLEDLDTALEVEEVRWHGLPKAFAHAAGDFDQMAAATDKETAADRAAAGHRRKARAALRPRPA